MLGVRRKRILVVASAGGHWIQMRRMISAFKNHDCVYVTTSFGYRADVGTDGYYCVRNAARSNGLWLLVLAGQVLSIVLRERPHVVISTGAAPGFFAIVFGKLLGAKTIWIDSIANGDRLSVSGRSVRHFADLWLTQWPHLATPRGPFYRGTVL